MPDLQARALLAPDVHRRGRVLADQHRGQPGRALPSIDELLDLVRDLAAYARGDRLAVDDPGAHGADAKGCAHGSTASVSDG